MQQRDPDAVQPPDDRQNQIPDSFLLPARPTVSDDAITHSDFQGGRLANRPPGYPNALVWLRVGILRDWRGVLGAFIAAWFNVPVALFLGVVLAVLGSVTMVFTGGGAFASLVPEEIRATPIVGGLINSFLDQSGSVIGVFVGAVLGFVIGLLLPLAIPAAAADNAVSLLTQLVGMVAAAILVGALYTLYRVLLEDRLLRVSGARDLSRRESELIMPILRECAERLGLPGVPRLLVEDDLVSTNARTYARHIVVTTGLLTDEREEIAALLSHELVHWRTGDEITSAFVRGVGLPLVLVHAVPTWLMRKFPHPATNLFVFILFWPVLLTMKYLVQPLHRMDVRAAEYRADTGAVVAGYTQGMRAVLERRRSFESGRSGWDEAVCAEHPPNELRLDRLERVRAEADTDESETLPRRVVGVEDLFGSSESVDLRRPVVIGGVALLSVCLLSTLLGVVQWSFFRPSVAVKGYFSALADRDADELAGWLSPEIGAMVRNDGQLVSMIESADYEPPTDVDIKKIDQEEDEATATVSVLLGEERVEAELLLRRDAKSTAGIFKGWHIVGGISTIAVNGGSPGAMINGVPLPDGPQSQSVLAVPGVHVVAVASNPLSEAAPQRISVQPGDGYETPVQVVAELKSAARSSIDEQVRSYLDDCAQQVVAEPQGCPFKLVGYESAEDITWTISKYPTLQIDVVGPEAAEVSTPFGSRGQVKVSGTYQGWYGPSEFTETYSVAVTGVVTAAGEQLSFQPQIDD